MSLERVHDHGHQMLVLGGNGTVAHDPFALGHVGVDELRVTLLQRLDPRRQCRLSHRDLLCQGEGQTSSASGSSISSARAPRNWAPRAPSRARWSQDRVSTMVGWTAGWPSWATTRSASMATARPILISALRTIAPSFHEAFTAGCWEMVAAMSFTSRSV